LDLLGYLLSLIMIPRLLEDQIRRQMKAFPVVALLGPRQVGKTTLATELYKSKKNKSVFLDLEDDDDQRKLIDPKKYLEEHENYCVIIDEVQQLPHLFNALRPSIDKKRIPGRFLLLGSASPHLVKGISQSLAGRIIYTELTPVLINEAEKVKIQQDTHWLRGGFPEPLLMKNDKNRYDWYKSFIKNYCEKDINHFFGIELSPKIIFNFWSMIAASGGNLWNAENFSRSLGVSAVTVKKYLEYLEAAYLVRVLSPWWMNATKRLIRSPKVYIRDSGLMNYMNKILTKEDIFGNPAVGASWEGYVIEQIIGNLPAEVSYYFYRTQNGAEADLVLAYANKPFATIEIKLSNAPVVTRGYYQSIEDLKTKYNYVVTPSSDKYPMNDKVICISLIEFINKELKKIIK